VASAGSPSKKGFACLDVFLVGKEKRARANAQRESKDSEEDKKEKVDLARFASDLEEGQALGGRFTRSG
jgi:hypothetical protein